MGYINPLLGLPAARNLVALPIESRRALATVLRALRTQANTEAEVAWSRRKGPMAAYWRAVATYARHLAHALEKGDSETKPDMTTLSHPAGHVATPDRQISPDESETVTIPVNERGADADQA